MARLVRSARFVLFLLTPVTISPLLKHVVTLSLQMERTAAIARSEHEQTLSTAAAIASAVGATASGAAQLLPPFSHVSINASNGVDTSGSGSGSVDGGAGNGAPQIAQASGSVVYSTVGSGSSAVDALSSPRAQLASPVPVPVPSPTPAASSPTPAGYAVTAQQHQDAGEPMCNWEAEYLPQATTLTLDWVGGAARSKRFPNLNHSSAP